MDLISLIQKKKNLPTRSLSMIVTLITTHKSIRLGLIVLSVYPQFKGESTIIILS